MQVIQILVAAVGGFVACMVKSLRILRDSRPGICLSAGSLWFLCSRTVPEFSEHLFSVGFVARTYEVDPSLVLRYSALKQQVLFLKATDTCFADTKFIFAGCLLAGTD